MEEYKEELTIPVYIRKTKEKDEQKMFDDLCSQNNTEVHYKTKPHTFLYEDIWAICTKDSYQKGISRGGALIFTKQSPIPYITADEYNVKKIIYELHCNPLESLSDLIQIGANQRLYAKLQKIVDGCYVMEYSEQATIKLHLTDEANRNQRWVLSVINEGPKKSCPMLTKKMVRERNRKKHDLFPK